MLCRFLIVVIACTGFQLKCPETAQWSIRARGHCPDPSKYFCLKNDLINGYSENCTVFDFLQPGRKNVLRGGLDADICSPERYQPWPMNFYTNVSTNCIFLKSVCNEEGQVVYDEGNRNTDTTCRCDYTSGYDFLVRPRHLCFCVPSSEDCSCYLKTCPDSSFKLTPDYECRQFRVNTSMSQCRPVINDKRVKSNGNQSIMQYIPRDNSISTPVAWKTFAWISFLCCFGILIVVCISKYYREVYFIEQPSDVQSVEGQFVRLEFKLLFIIFPVVFLKNDVIITKTSHIKIKRVGRLMILQINHLTAHDEGEYCLKVACIKSYLTMLTVKPLIKRTLKDATVMEGLNVQFECETEENCNIEWLKDDDLITTNTGSITEEILSGNVYRLNISSARPQDSGRYGIQTNGIYREAVLNVKEMPETIKEMSEQDKEEFLKAARDGTSQRYNIRVMIVGESSAGETCLFRRLINKPNYDVTTNYGLDVNRPKCQVDVQTGEWHFPTTETDSFGSAQNNQFADCEFLDFAGQEEMYATNQTFLSANAVYLLAVDTSEDFWKNAHDGIPDDSLGENIDFWLDNVHCYKTDVHNASSTCSKDLNPPVIIVCTGIDKISLNQSEDSLRKKFNDHLHKVISDNEKLRHLRKTHFLSNEFPSDNGEELKKLREDIFEKAKALKNWGDNLPWRWICLENEIYRRIYKAIYIISYSEAKKLAAKYSFQDVKQKSSELDSFLKYEHDIGNIIYFENVKDFIVLDPKWLVAVFKCFVSIKDKNELITMKERLDLENTGQLSNELIGKLLQSFPHLNIMKHKQFILQIMEKFDVIVKPRKKQASEIFYMPYLIKTATLNAIIRRFSVKKCEKKTSWFLLEFDFLHQSYFNLILVSFVKEKRLSITMDNQLCINSNIGLFDIDDSRTRVLVICFKQNCIAMQVLQWNDECHCYSDIKNKLLDLVHSMQLSYRLNVSYTKKFKCSDGNCFENMDRIDYDSVLEDCDYYCTEHEDTHQSKDVFNCWLTDNEIEEEYKNKGHKKCKYCENISMCKCYECNTVLCKNCSRIHKSKHHIIQLMSDSFILNYKFIVKNRYMSNIQCLSNGLLIVAVDMRLKQESEVIELSVSGEQRYIVKLEARQKGIYVKDNNTVAVLLENGSVAIVNIPNSNVVYIYDVAIGCCVWSFMYIENHLYVADTQGIAVICIDTDHAELRTEKNHIDLNFPPCDICYDVHSERIYCIDSDNSKLICIDRLGTIIFTFADPNWKNLNNLTRDNEGNMLVLCKQRDNDLECVIKVDFNGKSSEVVIRNVQFSNMYPNTGMCYHHLTNSVVISKRDTVFIYEKERKV